MSIGRPLEFDPQTALDVAMQVFWRQGYEATSLQDLLRAMGLSKSSFYQTFGSKQALFGRCLDHYRDRIAGQMQRRLEASPRARDFIAAMLDGVADEAGTQAERKGCLVMNTASEFGQSDADIAAHVEAGTGRFHAVFMAAVERAQSEGDIPPDKDPAVLARYLVANMSGLKTLVKAGAGRQAIRDTVAVTLSALE